MVKMLLPVMTFDFFKQLSLIDSFNVLNNDNIKTMSKVTQNH